MSRKPKKGYFVRGQFVAEGSELDIQLKAELKGTPDASRTDLKRESDALQDLGKELLTLRSDLFDAVGLPDKLVEAIVEAKRITNFEGKRRQMQYVGKLMRKLDPEIVEAARTALEALSKGYSAGFAAGLENDARLFGEVTASPSGQYWVDKFLLKDPQQSAVMTLLPPK